MLKIIQNERLNIAKEESSLNLWHCRFDHLGIDGVTTLKNSEMVEGMDGISKEK